MQIRNSLVASLCLALVACSKQGPAATPDLATASGPAVDASVPTDASVVRDLAEPPDLTPGDAALPIGTAISAPSNTWTWVPFPDAVCNDGSPLGIGINPSATSSNLIVYLNGGGACWDYLTCYIVAAATVGPYTTANFQSDLASQGAIFDRGDANNPVADWNFVFVPYCTGDVHAGDNVATYTLGPVAKTFAHKGHANFMAYLKRLAATFPTPGKVVIAGDSAGGAGATVNYASARAYWPNAESYLVNDSLPFFTPSQTPAATLSSELTNWNIKPLLESICAGCSADFSQIYAGLRARFPRDRMAYMGYDQDQTMSEYYETLPALFQADLTQLDVAAFVPQSWKTFFVDGTNHTILWSWATLGTSTSVNLRAWVNQMITDDPSWDSAGP